MAGLQRYTQKEFGIDAGTNEMAKYGSATTTQELFSGATINPDIIQSLPAFLEGLYSALGGAYSPTIQDQNSLFLLAFRQLAYILTRGIAEWDAGTIYNTNDICKVGPTTYYSLIDSNINNNPMSGPPYWRSNAIIAPTQQIITSGTGIYNLPVRNPLWIRVRAMGAGGGGCGGILGGGAGTSTGGDGGNTTFGVGKLTANGGEGSEIVGGGYNIGAPGAASFTVGFGQAFTGQEGSYGNVIDFSVLTSSASLTGGIGGQNLLGGAGRGGGISVAPGGLDGKAGRANSGAGGGGGFAEAATGVIQSGAGGSSGGYLDVIISGADLAPTFPYQIGVGGAGGTKVGFTAGDGGPGGSGYLIIDEFYQ